MPQAPLQPAEKRFRETHQLDGDAGLVHQFAGIDEERDRQQRKDVDARGHALKGDHQRNVQIEEGRQRRKAEAKRHRHPQCQQHREAAEQDR